MARIVVAGYVVRFPLGGNVWAHLPYAVGLARLGHEVTFVEAAGWEDSCYDPHREAMTSDPSFGLAVLSGLMAHFGLAGRWAYRDAAGAWFGLQAQAVEQAFAQADLYLDVGGTCTFAEMGAARRRAYVDMDPVFTQIAAFGMHADLDAFDVLFSYGARLHRPGSPVPTRGRQWLPLRPPVLLDVWDQPPAARRTGAAWTTVANWTAYGAAEYQGERYGQKDVEFLRVLDLPERTGLALEIAVGGEAVPFDALRAHGWRLVDPRPISRDPWAYRAYVQGSRGEFSVAKEAYVKSACGWFSDRTASYLAAGLPAVVQDTGLDGSPPAGRGLLVFRTPEEAAAALAAVEGDYEAHCAAARALAREHFGAGRVLTGLLAACGLR